MKYIKNELVKADTPYIKVPNTFIRYPTEDDTPAEERRVRLFLFIYFASSAGLFHRCSFSIEHLLRMMDVKTPQKNLKQKQIYNTLISALEWFVDNEYISEPDTPFDKAEVYDFFTVECLYEDLAIDGYFSDGKFRIKEKFTKITMYEFYTSISRGNSRIPLINLFTYSYIKSLIIHRRGKTIQEQAECCYLSYQQLQDACGVSRDGLRCSLEFLQNSELLDFQKPDNIEKFSPSGKAYRAAGKFSNLKTVFAINKPGYEAELKAGVENYIRENQKQFKYIGGGS